MRFWFCHEVFCFCCEVFGFAVTVVGHRSFENKHISLLMPPINEMPLKLNRCPAQLLHVGHL